MLKPGTPVLTHYGTGKIARPVNPMATDPPILYYVTIDDPAMISDEISAAIYRNTKELIFGEDELTLTAEAPGDVGFDPEVDTLLKQLRETLKQRGYSGFIVIGSREHAHYLHYLPEWSSVQFTADGFEYDPEHNPELSKSEQQMANLQSLANIYKMAAVVRQAKMLYETMQQKLIQFSNVRPSDFKIGQSKTGGGAEA